MAGYTNVTFIDWDPVCILATATGIQSLVPNLAKLGLDKLAVLPRVRAQVSH